MVESIQHRITVLIPVCDDRDLDSTICSALSQQYDRIEIIILRNGCNRKNDGKEMIIRSDRNISVKKHFIGKRGKGNALNIGLDIASYDFICVLDADCLLQPNALKNVFAHFRDSNVVAVGGRLLAKTEGRNSVYQPQCLEYEKNFNLMRPAFDKMNANCIISGAFGVFRKDALKKIGGYDTDTVGEDMELVLRLQEHTRKDKWKVVYEKDAECATSVPKNLYRLCRQRDRWQRGLLDCLKKHKRMIGNPKYGLLGMVVLPYQVISELLGPVFLMIHMVNIVCAVTGFDAYFRVIQILGLPNICQSWVIYGIYVAAECGITIWADLMERPKNMDLIKRVFVLVGITIESILLQPVLAFAKIFGMVTFRWRRRVW